MRIGCPKEIKPQEGRVGLTPAGVDALTRAARAEGIRIEYSGTPELAYVQGISDLYEFDCGDLSGWVFHVNGASPSVGCGEYVLTDGDLVEWLYSLDLGKDVEE